MLDLGFGLDFVGEVARLIRGIHLARIGRVDRPGEGVGAVQVGDRQRLKRGRERPEDRRGTEELLRREDAGEGRVAVGCLVGQFAGQAAQDAGRVALAQLLLVTQAAVLLVEVIAHQVDRRAAVGAPPDRPTDRVFVAPVDAGVVVQVLGVAVALEVGSGKADAERVAQRHVDHALDADVVELAVFTFGIGVERLQVGLGGDEVDDAGGGIAPEQGALRPAQDFDALQIEIVGFEDARAEQRQVVDVDRGRAVAADADAQVADAADSEVAAGEVTLGENDVGQGQLQVGRVVDLLRGKALRGEGGDRDRHVLQAL